MFKEILEKYGKVDVLVNNAGISRDGLMLRMKPEQWQSVIDLNLSGVYYTSQVYFKVSRNDGGCGQLRVRSFSDMLHCILLFPILFPIAYTCVVLTYLLQRRLTYSMLSRTRQKVVSSTLHLFPDCSAMRDKQTIRPLKLE